MGKLDPKKNPARRVQKVAMWPEADRRAWTAAIAPGDILKPGGRGAAWAPLTRNTVETCYGRWLAWLDRNGLLNTRAPESRVTPGAIVRYVADLQALNASYTVLSRVRHLSFAVSVMAPHQDWSWLQTVVTNLQRLAGTVRNKRAHIQPSDELFSFGLALMEKAEGASGGSPWRRANDYRDGLIVALLAARSLRRGNFTAIEIDRHLVRQGEAYWLYFDGAETKNGKPIEEPVPLALTPALQRYIAHYRSFLVRSTGHWGGKRTLHPPGDRLWVSSYGTAMSEGAVYDRVTKLTKAQFGKALNPHLFRDCAATSIAVEDPAHVGITLSALGHTSMMSSEKHYNHARSLEASRLYQRLMLDLRRRARDDGADDPVSGSWHEGSL